MEHLSIQVPHPPCLSRPVRAPGIFADQPAGINIYNNTPDGLPLDESLYRKFSQRAIPKILEMLSPSTLISKHVPENPSSLGLSPPFFLLSIGKAAAGMSDAIVNRWEIPPGNVLTLIPVGTPRPEQGAVLYGEHPFPGKKSISSTRKIMEKVRSLPKQTTLITAISGGTSSLLCSPADGISLRENVQIVRKCMRKGTPIDQLNQIRGALSKVKGGKLLSLFRGSTALTILLSDTPGLPPQTVGSGPTLPYQTPPGSPSPLEWLEQTLGEDQIPLSVRQALLKKQAFSDHQPETLPPLIIGNSHTVLQESIRFLMPEERIRMTAWTDSLKGESSTVGLVLGTLIISDRRGHEDTGCLYVATGETTVNLGTSKGQGGRTLELGLSMAQTLYSGGIHSFLTGVLATDGQDGNSSLAGVFIRGKDISMMTPSELHQALHTHNTAPLIRQYDLGIETGPTGTNLNDLLWVYIPEQTSWR